VFVRDVVGVFESQEMLTDRQVVVISGGSRGLGQALVTACLQHDYVVATCSRSTTPFIEELLTQDPARQTFMWESVDCTDYARVQQFTTEIVQCYGRIDVLINNAGIGVDGLLPLMRQSDIEQSIHLNIAGTIFLTRACSRAMLQQQSGCIINISSVNAIRGQAGIAVYSATKAALDGLTRSLAKELGPKNIRINSVAPGYFESTMVGHLTEAQKHRIMRRTPLGRLGTVDDITNLVLFLLSPQAAFVTGQIIAVDGGLTC
jgi:3-oxoacyl-[acyl-carrier protein] reductase